jgi:UDP-N-acetylmuramoylalanine--D-glutamate ligase
VCGDHPFTLLEDADLLCLSGGVSPMLPLVVSAQQRGIALSNDSQIFMEIVPCKVIGITGSAGKTTTTTLVGRIAQASVEQPLDQPSAYRKIWIGGNIGTPLISVIDEIQPEDLCVMELSSFQLELMTRSPQLAVILNITPNHLDRHGTMQAYTAAKARILQFQSPEDSAVLGRDDPGAWSLREMAPGRLSSFGFFDLPDGQPGVYQRGDAIYLRRYRPIRRRLSSMLRKLPCAARITCSMLWRQLPPQLQRVCPQKPCARASSDLPVCPTV